MNIFRFESASCFSQSEAPRQQQSAECDEDLLCLKMHVGAPSTEHLRGWWGWPATSLFLTSWVISSSQRRFRTPYLINNGHSPRWSVTQHRRAWCLLPRRRGAGCSGVYGKAEGMLLLWLNIYDCSDITCTAVLLYTNCAA